jgi:hypothetical protein
MKTTTMTRIVWGVRHIEKTKKMMMMRTSIDAMGLLEEEEEEEEEVEVVLARQRLE